MTPPTPKRKTDSFEHPELGRFTLPSDPQLTALAFATTKALNQAHRICKDAPHQVTPSVSTTTPGYYEFLRNLAERVNAQFPVDIQPDGITGPSGVATQFGEILTVPGTWMGNPAVPMMSNLAQRREAKLHDTATNPEHQRIYDEFIGLVRKLNPRLMSHPLRTGSSSVFPNFSPDTQVKLRHMLSISKGWDNVTKLVRQGDLKTLAADHGVILGSMVRYRRQPNKMELVDGQLVPKRRYTRDMLASRTGDRSGYSGLADMSVYNSKGAVEPGLSSKRVRGMFPFGPINLLEAAVVRPLHHALMIEFPFTFHYEGSQALLVHLIKRAPRFTASFDVRDHDVNQITNRIHQIIDDVLGDHLNEDALNVMHLQIASPFYVGPYEVQRMAQKEAIRVDPMRQWIADPLDIDNYKLQPGLESGHAINTYYGKLSMIVHYLCVMHDAGYEVIDRVESLLKGTHPEIACMNSVDDCLFMVNDGDGSQPTKLERFCRKGAAAKQSLSPYMTIEWEATGALYLGNVIYRKLDGTFGVCLAASSFLARFLAHERPFGDPHFRPYAALGYLQRMKEYASMPTFEGVRDALEDEYHNAFGLSLQLEMEAHARLNPVKMQENLTDLELEVLRDPDVLSWKIDPSEIRPQIAELFTHTIKLEDVYELVRPMLNPGSSLHQLD